MNNFRRTQLSAGDRTTVKWHSPTHTHTHIHIRMDVNTRTRIHTHIHTLTHTHLISTLSVANHPAELARLNNEMSTLMWGSTSTGESGVKKVVKEGKM